MKMYSSKERKKGKERKQEKKKRKNMKKDPKTPTLVILRAPGKLNKARRKA